MISISALRSDDINPTFYSASTLSLCYRSCSNLRCIPLDTATKVMAAQGHCRHDAAARRVKMGKSLEQQLKETGAADEVIPGAIEVQ